MKIVLVIITTFFLTAIPSFGQSATDSSKDPTTLGSAFFKALLDEDATTLEKLLTSGFNLTSSDGTAVDGDLLVQEVGGGAIVIETATVSDVETREYNNDAAIMTGNWKAQGSQQGKLFDTTFAFSAVSVKQSGAWKLVNVQLTSMSQ